MKSMRYGALFIHLLVVLGLAGCASYRPKLSSLKRLTPKVLPGAEKNCISFTYHIFSKNDCKIYLDRNVLGAGYQPVQITLSNHSKRYLYFSPSNFSFPCADVDVVARRLHTSTVGRAVGYGVAGLFIWPFLIPAIVDGVGSAQANHELDLDFDRKALCDEEVGPFNTLNGLIFVPLNYFEPHFSFTLVDAKTEERFILGTCKPLLKV